MKEIIQILTNRHGWETLCYVDQENTFVQDNGCTFKCNVIVALLHKASPNDTFRVLELDDEGED